MAQTQPSNAPAPAPKRRRGRTALLGCGGLVVLVLIIIVVAAIASSGGGNSNNNASGGSGTSTAGSNGGGNTTAGLGTPVRDGKFQFTVTRVSYARRVGDQYVGKTAQGRFTILHVTVKNIGSESQTLDDSSQYVFDGHGRKFDADSEADIYVNGGSDSVFFNDINPGNSLHGKIAFDLPKGVKAVKAELHDSAFSDGVTVTLP